MSRLSSAFTKGRPALITFVTCGDPSMQATDEILDALVEGGADIVELGMPFTDPMADGEVIQAANVRALSSGCTTQGILATARRFRDRHPEVPLILMGYCNTMIARGAAWFGQACSASGVDGIICVDLPIEEEHELAPSLHDAELSLIRLTTPTTGVKRLHQVLDGSQGFIYHVSVAGVTGKHQAQDAAIETQVRAIKAKTRLPVAVGFGIRSSDQARLIARYADGVVVGSVLVELISNHGVMAPEFVRAKVAELSAAITGN